MSGGTGAAIFENACPRCGRGPLFKSWLELHDQCSSCGARYMRDPGSWTGATVLTYVFACVFAFFLLIAIWATGNMNDGTGFVAGGITLPVAVVMYRPIKALWVGLLHSWGQVYPDKRPPEPIESQS